MEPIIKELTKTKIIGLSREISNVQKDTIELWKSFGPQIKNIKGKLNSNKISLQIYPHDYFASFDPGRKFLKWAAVAALEDSIIPEGLKSFTIPSGKYAVFLYKGPAGDPAIFQYIFGEWLPKSEFQLDNRPHFEVLGEKYSSTDPNSEEEIWIPVRK